MDRTALVLLFAAMLVVVAIAAADYPDQVNALVYGLLAGAILNWVNAERKK